MTRDRPDPASTAVLWTLAFAAVLSHLPAVGFDFAQDDFASLAHALGISEGSGPGARFWTTRATWSVLWPLFGTDPQPYHGLSLVLLTGIVVLTARVAARLGIGSAGGAVAGLLVLLGTSTAIPIAWVSASNELWAVLFALAALDLWLRPGVGPATVAATFLAVLSVHSKEPALGIGLSLLLATRFFLPGTERGARQARDLLAVVVLLGAVHAGLRVLGAFDPTGGGPYAFATSASFGEHLLRVLGWAAWPWSAHVAPSGVALAFGVVVLAAMGWSVAATVGAARHRAVFLLLAAVGSAIPGALIGRGPEPYHALLPSIAIALWGGAMLGERLTSALPTPRRRALAWTAAAVLVSGIAGWGIDARVHRRGDDGQLVHPVLRRTAITYGVRNQLVSIARSPAPPRAIGVLQATRMAGVEEIEEGKTPIYVGSPVFVALDGPRGLGVLTHEGPTASWVTHIDDLPERSFVFLDAGDPLLRPLGPPSNARMYTALVAVAAGQFPRARHALWNVIRDEGVQVRFAFDPANLPIRPEELDAEAEAFARFLTDTLGGDGTTSNSRILRLFEQIYETVRGKELVRDLEDLDALRAPRFDQ